MTELEEKNETKEKNDKEESEKEVCHKRTCRNNATELGKTKEQLANLRKQFLEVFGFISEMLEEEKKEAFQKAPKVKNEKGEEIKCANCQNSIALHPDFTNDAKQKEEVSQKEVELKLNGHSVFKHSTDKEISLKDVTVVFVNNEDSGIYRIVVGAGEKENREIYTNQVSAKDIDAKLGYNLELFVNGKMLESKKLEEKDVHQKIDLKINVWGTNEGDHVIATFFDEAVNLDEVKMEKSEAGWKLTFKDNIFTVNQEIVGTNPDHIHLKLFVNDEIVQQRKYSLTEEKNKV
ncbi:30916_t:CDS:2 [Racocetra persica]|uniref:30916_t:CDS:1 n=1 Tax=Racocetra persica TaxID=160502 RepID=A0ACA9NTQ1_9GLOM|nr:30916_t:CDS:2 [Racocetra persica]